MFQSIVVAVDGSDPANRALHAACALARAFGSEVHLIHAHDGPAAAKPTSVLEAARALASDDGVTT